MKEILGIDVGGSGIKGALVNVKKGELITERHRIPTPSPSTPEAVANTIKDIVKHFNYKGKIGCGFPAPIIDGVAMNAANIDKSWKGTNAEKVISKITGCKTKVYNDADAAGLAEATWGAGKNAKGTVLVITIGTGLGSALISDGKLIPNSELGHLPYGDTIYEKYAADSIRKKEDLSLKEWAGRFDEYLHLVNKLINPKLIILGGGLSKKFDSFGDHFTVKTKVVPAMLRNHAGIIGAAYAVSQ